MAFQLLGYSICSTVNQIDKSKNLSVIVQSLGTGEQKEGQQIEIKKICNIRYSKLCITYTFEQSPLEESPMNMEL